MLIDLRSLMRWLRQTQTPIDSHLLKPMYLLTQKLIDSHLLMRLLMLTLTLTDLRSLKHLYLLIDLHSLRLT